MLLSKRVIPYKTRTCTQALPYIHVPIIANIGLQPSIVRTKLQPQNHVVETKPAPDIKINDYEDEDFTTYTKMQETKLYADLLIQGLVGATVFIMLILLTKSLFSDNTIGGPPGMNKFINIGKTVDTNLLSITFNDVAGLDQAKLELQEIIDFLKNPKKYSDIGAKIPTGCLLAGNPGLGKTLLAKAVAGEAEVPFFAISASEFVELYVGVGLEKKDIIVSDEKKRIVAYHEAGHALVAYKIGDYDTIKKVSIIPRGGAGGITMFEHNESGLYKKEYLENQLAVALGGRVAETIILGSNVTTGAQSDLLRVQQLARDMIVKYGFRDTLGHIGWTDYDRHSEQLAYRIDDEIRLLSNIGYEKAKKIIVTNLDLLDKIATLLLEKETIIEQDIINLDHS
jgi:ATP-dependent Zn protease